MKYLTGSEIRKMYLDFFQEKGHAVEPSAPLVPHEDPSLLWINSGVATLKNTLMDVSFLKIQGLLMLKNQFAPMILKMLARPLATIHFSKCLEIFRLVNTLKWKQLNGHGNF